MGKTTLYWQIRGTDPDSFEVYRADSPMDKDNLPAPLADNIAGSARTYEDSTVVEDETYFYRVAARVGAALGVSQELRHKAEEAPWSPVLLSPQLWLDAADGGTITVDGSDGVSAWTDKSGNGHDVSQSTAASRPVLKSAEQNGLDVIRFDGSDDALLFDTPWPQAKEINAFMAGNTSSIGINYRVFLQRAPTSGGTVALLLGNSVISRQPTVLANGGRTAQNGTFYKKGIVRWAYAEDDTSSWALTQFDGGAENRKDPTTIKPAMLVDWVSISDDSTWQSAIDVYEIIITGPLTPGEIDRATGYLAWKWGLVSSLPGGHPYKSAPP